MSGEYQGPTACRSCPEKNNPPFLWYGLPGPSLGPERNTCTDDDGDDNDGDDNDDGDDDDDGDGGVNDDCDNGDHGDDCGMITMVMSEIMMTTVMISMITGAYNNDA